MNWKNNFSWQKSITIISLLLVSLASSAQDFPILLHSNGADAFVESMDVGPDGDIYVTGRIGVWNQYELGACAGVDFDSSFSCPIPTTVFQQDIFVARFHPDDVDLGLNRLVWMVRGRSSIDPSPELHSGKDIEVDSLGNVYFAGTLTGDVNFKRIHPLCDSFQLDCCPSTTTTRSFVGKIAADGTPLWIADTKIGGTFGQTQGEAITLDIPNNRLFTGGLVRTPGASVTVTMQNSNCTDQCSFIATPTPTGNVGFIAEYDLAGNNKRGEILGERVMALKVGLYEEHLWATGSIYNADMDVMLVEVFAPVVVTPCTPFSTNSFPIWGIGDDIGLDIDHANDGEVVLTGAFTTELIWSGGSTSVPAGMTDIFVGHLGAGFDISTTSMISGSPTLSSMSWKNRTSCIAADMVTPLGDRMIIGYNIDDDGTLGTLELNTNFSLPTSPSTISPSVATGNHARAMEIEFGPSGWDGKRYMAGDILHFDDVTVGYEFESVCTVGISGSHYEGYITQLDGSHNQTMIMLGTEETENPMKIELYPNPTDDLVTMGIDQDLVSLKIFDSEGRVLIEMEHLSAGEHSIDVSVFTPGIYLLELNSLEGNFTRKLIVQ